MATVSVSGIDEWASVCSESFVPLGVRGADDRFRGGLTHVPLTGEIGVTRVFSTSSEVFRDKRFIDRNPADDVLLSIQGKGVGFVSQAGRTTRLAGGSAALYDASQPYTLTFPGQMSELVLQVPRKTLGLGTKSDGGPWALGISATSPALVVLRSFLAGIVRSADDVAAPIREELADTAVSLLRSELAARLREDHPARAGREALLYSMKSFVRQRLADTRLTPETVAAAHSVSLRYTQLLFSENGGSPAQFIRTERLKAARRLLQDGRSVATAARLAGFLDPDTFTRAFKREFGELPSRVRQDPVGLRAR
jgi:AraC-like DNA-binding protein